MTLDITLRAPQLLTRLNDLFAEQESIDATETADAASLLGLIDTARLARLAPR